MAETARLPLGGQGEAIAYEAQGGGVTVLIWCPLGRWRKNSKRARLISEVNLRLHAVLPPERDVQIRWSRAPELPCGARAERPPRRQRSEARHQAEQKDSLGTASGALAHDI